MSPVDIITTFINQILSQPLFISSLAVGYPLFFFFFYHSKFWDRISFGERLAFGIGIGVPFSIFTEFLASVTGSIAGFLNVPHDFFSLWAVFDAGFILFFALARASIGNPLNSTEGYDWFRGGIERTKIIYGYMIFPFLVILVFFFPYADPSASMASINFIWVILVELLGIIVVTSLFFLVPISFLFCAPNVSKSVQLILMSFTYLLCFNYLTSSVADEMDSFNQKLTTLIRKISQAQFSRKAKVVFVISILTASAFILVADRSESIFSPRLVGEVTTYGSPQAQAYLYQHSAGLGEYFVVMPIETTFLFQPAAWPIFNTSVPNPGNYSQVEYQECSTGVGYGVQSVTSSGGIKYSLSCSNDIVKEFNIQPLWNHSKNLAQLVVLSYDNLTFASVNVTGVSLLRNFTNADGSQAQIFQFSIANGFPYPLMVSENNFLVQGLPQVNRTSASSYCMCPDNTTVYLVNAVGTEPIYAGGFYVQPHTLANVTLTISFKGAGS